MSGLFKVELTQEMLDGIIDAVRTMRELQCRYFRERTPEVLRLAKQAEKLVDLILAENFPKSKK
jgi:hypothetical protein